MCGIVGFASTESIDRDWLVTGRDSLIHRGPDDAGVWWSSDGHVGLAHRRLAILDLSPAGHQPMHLGNRGLTIVFNGEIYNFRELRNELTRLGYSFRSSSDTEVLLAAYDAWGDDFLIRLNGMFALALYDASRQSVLLARDRAGEKPLFYSLTNGSLYFASELKALMANPRLPRSVDLEALDCYLAMGFVPDKRCILQGFNKLPAAHSLRFDLNRGTADVRRYWELPDPPSGDSANEGALLDTLESLLEDAVGRQMVADVPVGILLSGGIDSSLVTAMAVRSSSKVRTFTICFPGHGKLDETEHARLIANHFGTEHTELVAEPSTADLIPQLVHQFDEPMVDSSMIPTWLVSNLVKQHCTVALGGDGGDELFGGYSHYSRLQLMEKRLPRVPRFIRSITAQAADHLLPVGLKGRNYLQALSSDFQCGLPLLSGCFDEGTRRRLMTGVQGYSPIAEAVRRNKVPDERDILQRATRMDFGNYLVEDILVKVDRASMLNSLEMRAPFLDYRLIEFAFGQVPGCLRATLSSKKILLKRLAAKILPQGFDLQRKWGFSIPMKQWLKAGPFRELFWSVLDSQDCMFNHHEVSKLMKRQDQGFNNGERLFALLQFELWRREYAVSL